MMKNEDVGYVMMRGILLQTVLTKYLRTITLLKLVTIITNQT